MNDKIADFITEVLTQVSRNGVDDTLKKKNIKAIYQKYCK